MEKTDLSAGKILSLFETKKSTFWERAREKQMLDVFARASREVPAYKDFLKKNHINPLKIKTLQDFVLVPPTSKKEYLRQYPLESLVAGGNLKKNLVWTSTSGSTGEPFYFPRAGKLDWQSSVIHEQFLRNSSYGTSGPTLVIVAFGMGVWIGGLITYRAFEIAAERGNYDLSIITPGLNKTEIFNALKNLAPHFKQVILAAYPPFMKDVLDEAEAQGIALKKLHLRLVTAAEPYTENFRDYLAKKAGIKNPHCDIMSVYGSADIGTMAFETPISIAWRRAALKNKNIFQGMFKGVMKLPTLAQYNPLNIAFEAPEGNILITGDNTIPLIRCDIGDRGGVFSFDEARNLMASSGANIIHEKINSATKKSVAELPFVYVYERSDFAVKLHLHDIYPETIRDALLQPMIRRAVTGKFAMSVKHDTTQSQYLELNVELRKGQVVDKKFESAALASVLSALEKGATGPGNIQDFVKRPNLVKLVCWPAEHPLYFKSGVKQKWVAPQEPATRLA